MTINGKEPDGVFLDEYTPCACIGPVGNDPVCPCHMRAKGLTPSSNWTEEDKKRLTELLSEIYGWDSSKHGTGPLTGDY